MITGTRSKNVEKRSSSTVGRFLRYGPLVLWMLFISFASTKGFSSLNTSTVIRPLVQLIFPDISEDGMAAIHFLIRKAGHVAEYAILAFLSRRALITSSLGLLQRRWFELAALLVVIYALLDEFHQSFVPSRTSSIYDSAIDVAGGLMVLLICKFHDKRSNNRRGQPA